VWLVSSGSGEGAPIDYVLGPLSRTAGSNPALGVGVGVVANVGATAWWRRERSSEPGAIRRLRVVLRGDRHERISKHLSWFVLSCDTEMSKW
jgi:hypothetical protein